MAKVNEICSAWLKNSEDTVGEILLNRTPTP